MSDTIGFIGLGMMGHGMAKNLLAKGFGLRFTAHRNRSNLARPAGRRRGRGEEPRRAGARRRRR